MGELKTEGNTTTVTWGFASETNTEERGVALSQVLQSQLKLPILEAGALTKTIMEYAGKWLTCESKCRSTTKTHDSATAMYKYIRKTVLKKLNDYGRRGYQTSASLCTHTC